MRIHLLSILTIGLCAATQPAQAQSSRVFGCRVPDSLYAQLWLKDTVVRAGAEPIVFFALTNQGRMPRRVLLGKANRIGGAWGLSIVVTDSQGNTWAQHPTKALLESQVYTPQALEKLKVPLPTQARRTVDFGFYDLLLVKEAGRTAAGHLPPGTYRLTFSYLPVTGEPGRPSTLPPLTLVVKP